MLRIKGGLYSRGNTASFRYSCSCHTFDSLKSILNKYKTWITKNIFKGINVNDKIISKVWNKEIKSFSNIRENRFSDWIPCLRHNGVHLDNVQKPSVRQFEELKEELSSFSLRNWFLCLKTVKVLSKYNFIFSNA